MSANWWTACNTLTPVAAWDATRVQGAKLMDGVGSNHITATSQLVYVTSPRVGVAGNSNPMQLTTPIPMPNVGVVAGFWSPKRDSVLLSDSYGANASFALHRAGAWANGQWLTNNNNAFAAYGYYGEIGESHFVAMVMRGTDSVLYVDGNLVGAPVGIGYVMTQIGQVGYGGNGNGNNLDADEYFHALGVWTGEATEYEIRVLEAAARTAVADRTFVNKDFPASASFGFTAANQYGEVLVSSDTKNLHFIGKAVLYRTVVSSSNCGGMYRWEFLINCLDYPTPFMTANGGYTGITAVRSSDIGWKIEIISTSYIIPEVYVFAPARSATFSGNYGVQVFRNDGSVSFDSRGGPLSLLATNMVQPSTNPRQAAISGSPWECRSMPNSSLTPDTFNNYYINAFSSSVKIIYHYASIAQAEREQEFTTGRWSEGGCADRREYELWSTYWAFYRAGLKIKKGSNGYIIAECGWVPVDAGCHQRRYESGRTFIGIGITGGGTSAGGRWPYQNETLNLQPTLMMLSDANLYDAGLQPDTGGVDDGSGGQGGGSGSWESMTGMPFYIYTLEGTHSFAQPESLLRAFVNDQNTYAAAQPRPPEFPYDPITVFTFDPATANIRNVGVITHPNMALDALQYEGDFTVSTWVFYTEELPTEPPTSELRRTLDVQSNTCVFFGEQVRFTAPSVNGGASISGDTNVEALANHCAARYAVGDCTDLWDVQITPAYISEDPNSPPLYGKYFGSYKIRINGVVTQVSKLPIDGIFPDGMVFPPTPTR